MVRQNQIIILLALVFLLLPTVQALTLEQNRNATLVFYPRNDGAVEAGVDCNVTILYPNNSVLVDYQATTEDGDKHSYNLSEAQTSTKGTYTGSITCEFSDGDQTEDFSYLINLGGVEPTQGRTDTVSVVIYMMFGIAVAFFIGFIVSGKLPWKFTMLLLALLFVLIAINLTFLSLQDQVVNPRLESFFSSFTAVSFVMYWGIGFLIFTVWILTFFVTIFDYMKQKKENKYGL